MVKCDQTFPDSSTSPAVIQQHTNLLWEMGLLPLNDGRKDKTSLDYIHSLQAGRGILHGNEVILF